MSAPPQDPPADSPPAEQHAPCPRCGTIADGSQEYCLECGLRLPRPEGLPARLGSAWRRHLRWYPGDWIWPVLGLVLVAGLGAAVAILATRSTRTAAPTTIVATNPPVSTATPTITFTEPTIPTLPPPTVTTPVTVPKPPKPPQPGHRPAAVLAWPQGHNGYTVVLSSIPKPSGHAAALAAARLAQAAGLKQVGVLDSDRFSSLHPGYYVVFSGVFGSYSQANSRLARAHGAGYNAAYPRRVTT